MKYFAFTLVNGSRIYSTTIKTVKSGPLVSRFPIYMYVPLLQSWTVSSYWKRPISATLMPCVFLPSCQHNSQTSPERHMRPTVGLCVSQVLKDLEYLGSGEVGGAERLLSIK